MWLFLACVFLFYAVLTVLVFCFKVYASLKTYATQPIEEIQEYDIELEVWEVGNNCDKIQEWEMAWEINRNETLDKK